MSEPTLTPQERAWIEATLALVPRNPRAARSRLRAKLSSAPPPKRPFRARLERAMGHALRATGDYEDAVAAYARARRAFVAMRDPLEHAITGLGLVDAYMYLGRHSEALRVARTARREFTRRRDLARLGKLEVNVGNLFHRSDDLRAALRHYRRARSLLLRQGSPSDIARIDYNRGNILASLGHTDSARHCFTTARAAFEVAGETVLASQVHYGDACLDLLSGEYAEAMAKLESVRPRLSRLGARPLLALADLDLAEVLFALRLYPEALTVARSAARWFSNRNVPLQLAASQHLAGAALIQLDRPLAGGRMLDRAAAGFRRQRHDSGLGSIELARATAARRAGRSLAAARHAERAERIFLRRHLRARSLHAGVAVVDSLFEGGRTRRAAARAQRLLRRYRSRHDAAARARLLRVTGKAAHDSGRCQEAIRRYERALEAWNQVQSGFFVDEWWLHYRQGEPALLEDLLPSVLALRPRPTAREVWRWISRVRARPGSRRPRKAPRPSREVEQEVVRLRHELDACHARLSGTPDLLRGDRAVGASRAMEERILSIESRLHRLAGVRGAGNRPSPRVSRRDSDLVVREPLIAYFSSGDRVGGLSLFPEGERLVTDLVCREELELRVRLLRHEVETLAQHPARREDEQGIARGLAAHLDELGARLLDPLVPPATRSQSVRVVPYGALNLLPLHLLTWRGRPFAELFEIVLGAPVPRSVVARPRRARALVLGYAPGRLGHMEREARFAAASLTEAGLDVTLHTGAAATREALRRSASCAEILHVAAHGAYRAEHPEFSALRLADGWMSVRELESLDLAGATVILSACESGTLGTASGDEALGVTRGFLRAGATSIVASLWAVDDRSTHQFMVELYRAWSRSRTLGAALQTTRRQLARRSLLTSALMGFVLHGAGDTPWPGLSHRRARGRMNHAR